MQKNKNIYKFTIDKKTTKKVEVKRKNKETGEEETILKDKVVSEPVKLIVQRPTRRLTEEAETQYAVEYSKAVKQGIVTKAMLAKQYMDSGGTLTEEETKDVLVLMREIQQKEDEYKLMVATEGETEESKTLQEEIMRTKRVLIDLDTSVQNVYQHTADARAERSLLLWYTVQLSKIVVDGIAKPFFDGAIYEQKLESLYEKEEGEGFDHEATAKFLKAVSYWFYSQNVSQEDIDDFVNAKDEEESQGAG